MNQTKEGFMYIFAEELNDNASYRIFNDYEGENFLFNTPMNNIRELAEMVVETSLGKAYLYDFPTTIKFRYEMPPSVCDIEVDISRLREGVSCMPISFYRDLTAEEIIQLKKEINDYRPKMKCNEPNRG